jgi:hypothetical protein
MSLRDAYREKFEAQVEVQRARLELLKAKAKRAVADGKIIAYEEIIEAEQKLAALRTKLKELGNASEAAWVTMKGGIEKAWEDVRESCKKAAGQFKGKP